MEDSVLAPISLSLVEDPAKVDLLQQATGLTSARVSKILSYKLLDDLCKANGLKGSQMSKFKCLLIVN
jgi:hypothetical protein